MIIFECTYFIAFSKSSYRSFIWDGNIKAGVWQHSYFILKVMSNFILLTLQYSQLNDIILYA